MAAACCLSFSLESPVALSQLFCLDVGPFLLQHSTTRVPAL